MSYASNSPIQIAPDPAGHVPGIIERLGNVLNRVCCLSSQASEYMAVVGAYQDLQNGAGTAVGNAPPREVTISTLLDDVQYTIGRMEDKFQLLDQHLKR